MLVLHFVPITVPHGFIRLVQASFLRSSALCQLVSKIGQWTSGYKSACVGWKQRQLARTRECHKKKGLKRQKKKKK